MSNKGKDELDNMEKDELDVSGKSNWSQQKWKTSFRRGLTVACEDSPPDEDLNNIRYSLGLYNDYPFARSLLAGSDTREEALRKSGTKQADYVKSTDGWLRSMFVIQGRAPDNFAVPWAIITINALICAVVHEVLNFNFWEDTVLHWEAAYSSVLQASLAFLLVFRLNRIAVRFWETRTMWGEVTSNSRALVSGILAHVDHAPELRDRSIAWVGAFAIATMHSIRRDYDIPSEELSGFLDRADIDRMEDANHAPLYAASQIRYSLKKALQITPSTAPPVAHSYAIQMNLFETLINKLIAQISGMEKVRSTPLPLVYVSHLRTFLFFHLLCLPYIWVGSWGWATIPFVSFTSFGLLGIEGASTECEIPFNKSRPNHLAIDNYCLILLDNIQGLVVQHANEDMEEKRICRHEP